MMQLDDDDNSIEIEKPEIETFDFEKKDNDDLPFDKNVTSNVALSCELFRHLLETVSNISLCGYFHFDKEDGMSCSVIDTNEHLLVEFKIAPTTFEWYLLATSHVDMPIYFHVWLEFISRLKKPAEFIIELFPEACCIRGLCIPKQSKNTIKELRRTKIHSFQESDDMMYICENNSTYFPEICAQDYHHLIEMYRAEFAHQLENGLIDPEIIHLAISKHHLMFYCENDGRASTFIPVTRLDPEHNVEHKTLLEHQNLNCSKIEYIRKINEDQIQANEKMSMKIQVQRAHQIIDTNCFIQAHSIRYLCFSFKDHHDCHKIILGLSKTQGLLVIFPITGYGIGDLDVNKELKHTSYVRYRLLVPRITTRTIQPLPERQIQLLKQF